MAGRALPPRLAGCRGKDAYGLVSGALHAGTVELVDARAGLACPVLGAKATQEPLHGLNEPPLSSKECDPRVEQAQKMRSQNQ